MEKVGWVHVRDGKLLVARNAGRDLFYLPGGRREAGETDADTLTREVREELGVTLDRSTLRHFLTCVARRDGSHEMLRMICYTASHEGPIRPRSEIAELGWFSYADYERVTHAEQQVMDRLGATGQIF